MVRSVSRYQHRSARASISFEAGAVIFGLMFALTAGYVASFTGDRPHFVAAWIVGALVAVTAVVNMIRNGVAWPQRCSSWRLRW